MLITPKKVDFGLTENNNLWKYIDDQVSMLEKKTERFRTKTLPEWARKYKGIPTNEKIDFPWENASNIVIQLSATHCDQLLSRVMAIHQIEPVWPLRGWGDLPEQLSTVEMLGAVEEMFTVFATDPFELNLFRVEEQWFSNSIKYGTGCLYFPWQYNMEWTPTFVPGASPNTGKFDYSNQCIKDGPVPTNIPLNRFVVSPEATDLYTARFKYIKIPYTEMELRQLKGQDINSKDAINDIIKAGPDRYGADEFEKETKENKLDKEEQSPTSGIWDLFICFFPYYHSGINYRLICLYHPKSKSKVNCIFNFYPENIEPLEDAKLAYDDSGYLGYGLIEMLKHYQTEVSTIHNQATDNRTLQNMSIFRINKNSKLHSMLKIYPGMTIPADKDEAELWNLGAKADDATERENLTLMLAKERSGIDPAMGGSGGGIINPKRGVYSASGTMATMALQNNRTNLRIADMRSAHARFGQKLLTLYAHFGIKNIDLFGSRAALIQKAMENVKAKKLGVSMRAATASVNRELERQNDMLIATTLSRMYTEDAQIIQVLVNPATPPELKDYYIQVLAAKRLITMAILRSFGKDDADKLVPKAPQLNQGDQNGPVPNNAPVSPASNGQGASGGGQSSSIPQSSGQGTIPITGGNSPM